MRIVHVIGSIAPRLGGPSKAVLEMCAALAARGHQVDVVTTILSDRGSWSPLVRPASSEAVKAGERVARDGYYITYCRPIWPTRWVTSPEMVRVLRRLVPGADVVHIHSLYLFSTLVASRIARVNRVPYVLRPHGTLDPYVRRRHRSLKRLYHLIVEDATLKHAAAIHFTSEGERALARPAISPGVKSCVIPLGVELRGYNNLPPRAVARKALGLPGEALVSLFLGRLNHKKGLDLLAPAFIRLASGSPDAWLVLAGPDDDKLGQRFIEECQGAGVADRVVRPGLLDPAGVRLAFAAADYWVLPSYSENFGLAVAEAMAACLPVVITDRVNIWPLVESVAAGLVARPTVDSLAECMGLVASMSPEARRDMGQRGRLLCEREFDCGKVAQQLERLYSSFAIGN